MTTQTTQAATHHTGIRHAVAAMPSQRRSCFRPGKGAGHPATIVAFDMTLRITRRPDPPCDAVAPRWLVIWSHLLPPGFGANRPVSAAAILRGSRHPATGGRCSAGFERKRAGEPADRRQPTSYSPSIAHPTSVRRPVETTPQSHPDERS
jgi:hypothetical protein